MRELLIGCGSRAQSIKRLHPKGGDGEWENVTRLDINPCHEPDVVHDLEQAHLPFRDESFDEIHAYEVLEHIGQQGDHRTFFAQFSDYWRVLRPGGLFCASVPDLRSPWVWGDPSHRRFIGKGTLSFLYQPSYDECGETNRTDFRYCYEADFEPIYQYLDEGSWSYFFVLKAVKPSRLRAYRKTVG